MTGWENSALQVSPGVSHKGLGKFSKALYEKT